MFERPFLMALCTAETSGIGGRRFKSSRLDHAGRAVDRKRDSNEVRGLGYVSAKGRFCRCAVSVTAPC